MAPLLGDLRIAKHDDEDDEGEHDEEEEGDEDGHHGRRGLLGLRLLNFEARLLGGRIVSFRNCSHGYASIAGLC